MRNILSFLFLLLVVFSCKESTTNEAMPQLSSPLQLARFDVDFYQTSPQTLAATKAAYPLLFPAGVSDSIWVQKINDSDEQELFAETQKVFPDNAFLTAAFTGLFAEVTQRNPKFKVPKVIALLSNIDYENRVIYADSLLLVSLDAYLGASHPFYETYPNYIAVNNHKDHLIIDVAEVLISKQVPKNTQRTFLGKMIYEGKKMYLLDQYVPQSSAMEKMGYSKEKYAWAVENEVPVWMYFMEKELLYSTNTKLAPRFLNQAPFSKFYLGEDTLSPGRIGVWIGWRIVQSYMAHNSVSLQELFRIDPLELFQQSHYKPKK